MNLTISEAEYRRRMRPLHPKARRQLAAMTDTTFRPANLHRPTFSERLGEALESPVVVAYAKVCMTGMVGLAGLCAFIIMIGAFAAP